MVVVPFARFPTMETKQKSKYVLPFAVHTYSSRKGVNNHPHEREEREAKENQAQ